MDVRNNSLVKPAGVLDRDISRLANSGAVQGEDRTLSVGVDGWEKAKMKKKRSGIKADGSPSMASSKHVDGYRESKQGMQQRPVNDNRSRLSSDSHGFRYELSNMYCDYLISFSSIFIKVPLDMYVYLYICLLIRVLREKCKVLWPLLGTFNFYLLLKNTLIVSPSSLISIIFLKHPTSFSFKSNEFCMQHTLSMCCCHDNNRAYILTVKIFASAIQ